MAKAKKLTKKELENIVAKLQLKNNQLLKIGALEADKLVALKALDEINAQVGETQKQLEDKYGSVNVNLETGEISPVDE